MLGEVTDLLNTAAAAAGPFGVVFGLVGAIIEVAERVKANHAAAKALGDHAKLVAVTLQNQLRDGHNEAVQRGVDALREVLERIERLLKKTAERSGLQQTLSSRTTAARIKELDEELSDKQQDLGLAVSLQVDAVAKAIQQDVADLPALLESLMSNVDGKFEVVSERLETLLAIEQNQSDLLNTLPDRLAPKLVELLSNTKTDILMFSGRDLSRSHNWSVNPDDVDIIWKQRIGAGGFGEVYTAIWDDGKVAVKVLSGGTKGQEAVRTIEKEASVWYPLNHPNVLRLWRVCLNADRPFIVMELMKQDLSAYLRERPDTSIPVRTGLILSIARGMQYLHRCTPPIIHGDLKAANVLIGEDGVVRIADFGMAFIKANSRANTGRRTTALRWVAPEKYKRGYKLETPSDVFGFAMTAIEILTGKVPFSYLNSDDEAKKEIKEGKRPPRPSDIPDALWDLIEDCWQEDPKLRPSFAQIVKRVDRLPTERPSTDPLPQPAANLNPRAPSPAPPSPHPPAARDIEILLDVFPDWCRSKGVTAANFLGFHETVTGEDDEPVEMLEWNNDGQLLALRLMDQGLTGALSPRIGDLVNLQNLWLCDNEITELPESIGNLTNLTHLLVPRNKLMRLPESVGRLGKLKWLDLEGNCLTSVPESVGRLASLTAIDLERNRLTSLPSSFGQLKRTAELHLDGNPVPAEALLEALN